MRTRILNFILWSDSTLTRTLLFFVAAIAMVITVAIFVHGMPNKAVALVSFIVFLCSLLYILTAEGYLGFVGQYDEAFRYMESASHAEGADTIMKIVTGEIGGSKLFTDDFFNKRYWGKLLARLKTIRSSLGGDWDRRLLLWGALNEALEKQDESFTWTKNAYAVMWAERNGLRREIDALRQKFTSEYEKLANEKGDVLTTYITSDLRRLEEMEGTMYRRLALLFEKGGEGTEILLWIRELYGDKGLGEKKVLSFLKGLEKTQNSFSETV